MSFHTVVMRRKPEDQNLGQFCDSLGIPANTVRNWKMSEPKPSTIWQVAKALNIKPGLLFEEYMEDIEGGNGDA